MRTLTLLASLSLSSADITTDLLPVGVLLEAMPGQPRPSCGIVALLFNDDAENGFDEFDLDKAEAKEEEEGA